MSCCQCKPCCRPCCCRKRRVRRRRSRGNNNLLLLGILALLAFRGGNTAPNENVNVVNLNNGNVDDVYDDDYGDDDDDNCDCGCGCHYNY